MAAEIGAGGVSHDDDIAKVSRSSGAGMKTTPGIAAKMFRVAGRRGHQHRDDLDVDHPHLGRRGGRRHGAGRCGALHTAFGLDSGQAYSAPCPSAASVRSRLGFGNPPGRSVGRR